MGSAHVCAGFRGVFQHESGADRGTSGAGHVFRAYDQAAAGKGNTYGTAGRSRHRHACDSGTEGSGHVQYGH